MSVHTLQQVFDGLLHTDRRPLAGRDLFQKAHGRKRTQIESVRIIPAPSAPPAFAAGAAPPPLRQLTQTSVANAGTTTTGMLTRGPMDPSAINQHILADCWLLVAILLVLFRDPLFFDDLIVPVGNNQVVVQFYSSGTIVQILTSLIISTDYDRPDNGDIRPELLEKAYSLFRAGISDYFQDNLGTVTAALAAFGLDTNLSSTNVVVSLLSAGKVVALQTSATAPSPWVQDHFYAVRAADAAGSLILRNPWTGALDLAPLPPATVNNTAIFIAAHVGTFPSAKRLLAAYVPAPTQAPSPIPATLAVSVSDPLQSTSQEKPMTTTVSSTQPVTLPISAATLFDCRTETQGGRADIGYLLGDGYAEETLEIPAAGTFTLTLPVAALAAGAFHISINGRIVATVPYPATGAWSSFINVEAALPLPAGTATLRIAPTAGAQYNLADLTLAPVKQMKSLAIDFVNRTATALYQDGTTALLA